MHIWDNGVPKIDLIAFDWCPGSQRKCSQSLRSSLAIASPLETDQFTVTAAAAAAAMIDVTSGNILNSSDWGCPINPNMACY